MCRRARERSAKANRRLRLRSQATWQREPGILRLDLSFERTDFKSFEPVRYGMYRSGHTRSRTESQERMITLVKRENGTYEKDTLEHEHDFRAFISFIGSGCCHDQLREQQLIFEHPNNRDGQDLC